MLLRLRDPDAGRLLYAGHDLRRFRGADWHSRLAWLPQEAPIFAGSVRDNLRIGDPAADDARLWRALAQVRLDTLVRSWNDGLDGWVGESGATLSAGQARRLALARALLRDTPLLLLDEPTEGLDQDTADALMRDIAEAAADRAVLIITHAPLPPGTVHESHRLIDGWCADRGAELAPLYAKRAPLVERSPLRVAMSHARAEPSRERQAKRKRSKLRSTRGFRADDAPAYSRISASATRRLRSFRVTRCGSSVAIRPSWRRRVKLRLTVSTVRPR